MQSPPLAEGFWSDTYRGHTIAILNHGGRWLVYLDHVLQQRLQFDTPEAAVNWLQRKVDKPKERLRLH
ncbi:MAG TPA: hypothetical protein VH519_02875 [Hyphomicrobiaceae bacterium]|jgi:hypothetical protein